MEVVPGGQPGTDNEVKLNMPSGMSKYRFVRFRISTPTSRIICGHLEATGGWSWRPVTYRYGGQTLIYLYACLNVCLFGSGFQFSHKKWYQATWRLFLEASQVQIWRSNSNIPLCISKYRFVRGRISILTSKIISGYLEAE